MKKITAILLALTLVCGLLAGCGDSSASEESALSGSVSASEAEVTVGAENAENSSVGETMEETTEEEAPAEELPSEIEPEEIMEQESAVPDKIIPIANTYALPLCEETETFTFFWTYPPFLAEQIDDLTDGYAKQALEEQTNVHIEFDAVAASVASESFNLMVASGDYTDIIQDVTTYYGVGMDRAVEDSIVIDLTELITSTMENYNNMITANDEIHKALTSSDGYIGAIYRLYSEPSVPKTGNVIRQDWLDDLGLELPTTIDDYYNVLTAFRDEKGAAGGYYIMNTGIAYSNAIIGAYGVQGDFYQQNGIVKYGYTEQGFKDYLTEMNRWYNEGLISGDYINNVSGYPDNGDVTAGVLGIFPQENTYMEDVYSFTDDTSIVLSAAPNAILEDGDTNDFIPFGDWIGGISWSISTNCENPELLATFIDYLFTEEGSLLANYGVEGLSWDYNSNGDPVINEAITNNPDYNTSMAQLKYTLLWAPFVEDYDRFNVGYTQAEIDAADIWQINSTSDWPDSGWCYDFHGICNGVQYDLHRYRHLCV